MSEEVNVLEVQQKIRDKYASVSQTADGKFKYPTGKEGLLTLGYDPLFTKDLPKESVESFCGVGNPFGLGPINLSEKVLDIGCGAGVDTIIASRLVGKDGWVHLGSPGEVCDY